MNRKQIAGIFLACAAILGAGVYVLLSTPKTPGPEVRQTVAPPAQPPAKAPDWVGKGQTPEPDYSPATSEPHNATPVPPPAEPKTDVIEIREDRIVTFSFVESLADYFLNHFVPKTEHGNPATRVTVKGLNMHYGREMTGLTTSGEDIRAMRKGVLDYAFTPAVITSLGEAYIPLFMDRLVESALNDEREYSNAGVKRLRTHLKETAAMLRSNAAVIDRTSIIFRTLASDPELVNMAARYLQVAKAVKRANATLQNAIADQGNTKEAGQRYKQAILQRESAKAAIVSRMKKSCSGCSPSELFYLAQWSYRRTLGENKGKLEAFNAAADALDKLSRRFTEKSTELDSE